MRISYSLGSVLKIDEVLECASHIGGMKEQPDTVWIPETWGMEYFAMASAVSQRAAKPRIGSSIINVYSRTPALAAMGAATIDALSGGRFVLGLGASSRPIVEDLHGVKYASHLGRMREYVDIVRMAYAGKRIDYDGRFYKLRGFELLAKPPRKSIPVYIAAVNEGMVDLCWQIADGVIFYLRPLSEMRRTVSRMQAVKKIDVACQIITAVSDDPEKAAKRAKSTLAFYVAVGSVYRDFLAKNGFEEETAAIFEQYSKDGLDGLHGAVPERMLRELAIFGTAEECSKMISAFYDAGITHPIIQFNPVGSTAESFRTTCSAFSGGGLT